MSQPQASGSSEGRERGDRAPTTTAVKVDLSMVNRGIWLVKVPKYLAARWEKIPGDVEAGKLKIYKTGADAAPRVTLSLSDATMCLKEPGENDIPREHSLIAGPVVHQTLAAFDHVTGISDALVQEPDKVSILGKVHQKLECRPPSDVGYMLMKKEEIRKASQPVRSVQQLDRVVNNYKPVADHKNNIEYEERKKAEGKKAREDKDKVLEMLFAAFEKHQYYNVKDLVKITNQPIGYLKEVLKEVCNYCVKNPHKNMWELKPEYRHYKQDVDD
ncbi:general transcription factor IIF subunit 2 [Folsomia candida]|uniref:General transcription factor IIF subunit 2 n=1 Tax=Folsomia candida TaxID=158441 RepID=A0A226DMQ6_FOLCA|nr:general transcription factor IIF subunit 2 [Folsomia candida]XP_035712847.1 general transcription factor IIF subunit 2 [Folsomia candida]OXA46469.1 General transcription factor IIF subunit 2 [Folsomia candida]